MGREKSDFELNFRVDSRFERVQFGFKLITKVDLAGSGCDPLLYETTLVELSTETITLKNSVPKVR